MNAHPKRHENRGQARQPVAKRAARLARRHHDRPGGSGGSTGHLGETAAGVLRASPVAGLLPARGGPGPPYRPLRRAALLGAHHSPFVRRDAVLLLYVLDTCARDRTLCRIGLQEVDFTNRRVTVLGKGNKHRALPFGRVCGQALWRDVRDPHAPRFHQDRGTRAGRAFTRSGNRDGVDRLGRTAALVACRCTTHRFRHTMAIVFLRAGGNVFTLKELLGHTTLTMMNRSVVLAQTNIENDHCQFAPANRNLPALDE